MARRFFAVLDDDGEVAEYVSPEEGGPYEARLAETVPHLEVHPETRELLKPRKAKAPEPKTNQPAGAKASA